APGLEVRLLEGVGGVDASLEALVEAQGEHAAQAIAVPGQERAPPHTVARGRPAEEVIGFTGVIGHGGPHTTLTALGVDQETKMKTGGRAPALPSNDRSRYDRARTAPGLGRTRNAVAAGAATKGTPCAASTT